MADGQPCPKCVQHLMDSPYHSALDAQEHPVPVLLCLYCETLFIRTGTGQVVEIATFLGLGHRHGMAS